MRKFVTAIVKVSSGGGCPRMIIQFLETLNRRRVNRQRANAGRRWSAKKLIKSWMAVRAINHAGPGAHGRSPTIVMRCKSRARYPSGRIAEATAVTGALRGCCEAASRRALLRRAFECEAQQLCVRVCASFKYYYSDIMKCTHVLRELHALFRI